MIQKATLSAFDPHQFVSAFIATWHAAETKPERGPSKHMLAITHGGKVLKVKLAPYYLEQPSAPGRNGMATKSAAKPAPEAKKAAPAPMASPAIMSYPPKFGH
jgi:hypothetical protein